MSIFSKLRDLFDLKDPLRKADKLYRKALKAITAGQFRNAAIALEEGAKLNPQSAAIHNILGYSYSRIAGDFPGNEAAMNSWMGKAADTFWQAILLHRQYGGLESKQVKSALEIVAAVDRLAITEADLPVEEQQKQIFCDYIAMREGGFDTFSVIGDMLRGNSLADMAGSLNRGVADAEEKAVHRLTQTYSISERHLRAIMQEGENKKWR